MKLEVGKLNIGWMGDNLKEHFGSMEFTVPEKLKLECRKLEKPMLDKDILAEWKPKESTPGELAWALKDEKKLLKDGYYNIFYIRDKDNILWAVSASWYSFRRSWNVGADSVGRSYEWNAGDLVLSQAFGVLETSNPLSLETRIKSLENDMEKLKKFLII